MIEVRKTGQEAGFSLLELLLVVGVGALLLLAGISTYRLVTQGTSVNEAVRVLTTLKEKTQRAFQGQRGYSNGADGTISSILVTMNAFPAGVLDSNNVPRHTWGDTIDIAANPSDAQKFDITFNNVPSSACVSLGTSFYEDDTDFFSLDIDGQTFDSGNPVTVASIAAACGTGTVTMTWTFF